jgi:transposase
LSRFKSENREIVYLDESGFKVSDHRPYGYAARGKACQSEYNWQLKNQTNAIGAIHHKKLCAVGLFDCNINSDIFHGWIEQVLIPELPKTSIIVMDNATFHKRKDTQELIESHGHQILWLPAYSPDYNPIEQMWAWVKKKRQEWRIDCVDFLFKVFLLICINSMVQ